jgi:hypothetical protein
MPWNGLLFCYFITPYQLRKSCSDDQCMTHDYFEREGDLKEAVLTNFYKLSIGVTVKGIRYTRKILIQYR